MPQLHITLAGAVGFPAANAINFTTFSDAHLARILVWVQRTQNALIQSMFNPAGDPSFVPTNVQLYQAWIQDFINRSINAEAISSTPAPVPPSPVVIGP